MKIEVHWKACMMTIAIGPQQRSMPASCLYLQSACSQSLPRECLVILDMTCCQRTVHHVHDMSEDCQRTVRGHVRGHVHQQIKVYCRVCKSKHTLASLCMCGCALPEEKQSMAVMRIPVEQYMHIEIYVICTNSNLASQLGVNPTDTGSISQSYKSSHVAAASATNSLGQPHSSSNSSSRGFTTQHAIISLLTSSCFFAAEEGLQLTTVGLLSTSPATNVRQPHR